LNNKDVKQVATADSPSAPNRSEVFQDKPLY